MRLTSEIIGWIELLELSQLSFQLPNDS